MSKPKHTPGPWKLWIAHSSSPSIEVQCNERTPVVKWAGFDDSNREKETHIANARLIAAAPELLQLALYLKAHLDEGAQQVYFSSLPTDDDEITLADMVLRAIAKAGGKDE